MHDAFPLAAQEILRERFGRDSLIALATLDNGAPCVRTVNALYLDGSFYVITHAQSSKMRQIQLNPAVAVCGDWFTARGTGENLGHILLPENAALADRLRAAFASWYHNGHVCESDPNTVILRLHLRTGVLMNCGTRYDIVFP
ncbi:MAG: pyridoxamine 5'-phosphate oxidase family protein [Clostridia bacterium]|nr:pyridoxamine 5'-phosphate oxidase family protein [Clostridia bacterium]